MKIFTPVYLIYINKKIHKVSQTLVPRVKHGKVDIRYKSIKNQVLVIPQIGM